MGVLSKYNIVSSNAKMTYRNSTYNIIVKIDKNQYGMLNSLTGAIDIISSKYIISSDIDINTHILPNNLKVKLQERGYLTTLTKKSESDIYKKIASAINKKEKNEAKFVFLVTYDCNFNCFYCYENGSAKSIKSSFTKNKILSAFTNFDRLSKRHKSVSKEITLMGGEPILKKNIEIIKEIINQGNQKKYKFNVISNGFEINYFKNILNEKIFTSFQITIDGPQQIHDKRRTHKMNIPTFERITNNIDLLLSKGIKTSIRINIDESNKNYINELLSFIEIKEWEKHDNFSYYIAPVFNNCLAFNNIKNFHLIENLKNKLNISDSFNIDKKLEEYFTGVSKLLFRTSFCGAQTGMYIFDPLGYIYTCWDIVGNKNLSIGKYYPDFKLNENRIKLWQEKSIFDMDNCRNCKYSLLCGGGCIARSLSINDSIKTGYCSNFIENFNNSLKRLFINYLQKGGQNE